MHSEVNLIEFNGVYFLINVPRAHSATGSAHLLATAACALAAGTQFPHKTETLASEPNVITLFYGNWKKLKPLSAATGSYCQE